MLTDKEKYPWSEDLNTISLDLANLYIARVLRMMNMFRQAGVPDSDIIQRGYDILFQLVDANKGKTHSLFASFADTLVVFHVLLERWGEEHPYIS